MKRHILLTTILTLSLNADAFTNSIGMSFSKIPAGSFMMGKNQPQSCPKDDPFTSVNEYKICINDRDTRAYPYHKVTLESFYMGTTKVTQGQWYKVMGYNPTEFSVGKNIPVFNMSKNDIKAFIRELNKLENTSNYFLPSESQWEYAARAGSDTEWFFGDDKNQIEKYELKPAWSGDRMGDVAQKLPNPWGLYEMYHNGPEQIADCWHLNYDGAPTDGTAWTENCKIGYTMYRGENSYKREFFSTDYDRRLSLSFRVGYKGIKEEPVKSNLNAFAKQEEMKEKPKKTVKINTDTQDANFFNSLDDVDHKNPVNIE